MFKRFTERARRIIILAREEAEHYRHEYLGTEHILLGVLKDGGGVAIEVLHKMGVDIKNAREKVEKSLPQSSSVVNIGDIPFTSRAKKVLEYSVEEARAVGHNYIGSEHILLGLVKEKEGQASKILTGFGIYYTETRKNILNMLKEPVVTIPEEEKTPVLDEFSRDLTALALKGKLDPVIGRNLEIERVIQILSRRTKNNPVLIGEAGVGKTAIVEGLAQRIVEIEVPETLYNKRVISLDLGALVAGTKYRGQFEARLKGIMKEISINNNKIILFIDELHTLVGAGAAEGSVDASNMLKPALSRGEIQCVGATTLEEYRKYIEKNGALERRFQPIMVNPPSVKETIEIIKGLKTEYELHHHTKITDYAIKKTVMFADRYINDRFLPDKAIDVIDEACSRARLKKVMYPPEIREIQRKMDEIARNKKAKIESQDFEEAVELRDEEEKLKSSLEVAKKKWKAKNKLVEQVITEDDISYVVSSMTGIPLSKIEKKESQRLREMEKELSQKVVGQEEAIQAITKAIRRSRAGLSDFKRPIGSFLFLGPTGVGKTELATALAEFMFGERDALIRLDMSEYGEKFNISRLTGAPPGYIGHDEGGQLTEKVRRRPYSVVLFDELEKAHPDIYNMLLQILDDGRLTDSYGRVVNFKNVIIIMTSNLSSRVVGKGTKLGFQKQDIATSYEKMKETISGELRKSFSPEFLSRITQTIVFKHLEKKHIMSIVDIHLTELNKQLIEKGLTIEITSEAKDWLAQKGYNVSFGARPLRQTIQEFLEDPLSDEMLKGKYQEGGVIEVGLQDNHLIFIEKLGLIKSLSG